LACCLHIKQSLEKQGQKIPSIYPLLQFVAIGTISDLAKLDQLNRTLCRHGLRQLPKTQFEGIKTFLSPEEQKQKTISSEKISFLIGPMINSKGRIDHPKIALKLLISKTHNEAWPYFSQLEISNRERKLIQHEVFNEAKALFLKELKKGTPPIIILHQLTGTKGVIGIVAR